MASTTCVIPISKKKSLIVSSSDEETINSGGSALYSLVRLKTNELFQRQHCEKGGVCEFLKPFETVLLRRSEGGTQK